jgi:hypothetical protein
MLDMLMSSVMVGSRLGLKLKMTKSIDLSYQVVHDDVIVARNLANQ